MVRISCLGKTHAFQLAEQLEKHQILDKLYTTYHSEINSFVAKFNSRRDVEKINREHIRTFPLLAPLFRLTSRTFENNQIYDSLVSHQLKKDVFYKVFIGWSGMSIKSLQQAKKDGKLCVIERGSSHIRSQYEILEHEYRKWGKKFNGDERLAAQEEMEYETADFVIIPSNFVRKTFLDRGFAKEKLFVNNFGSSSLFSPSKPKRKRFTIVYAGTLNFRKGLPYLFEALQALPLKEEDYDVWFIGSINPELNDLINRSRRNNWTFFGHVSFDRLSDLVSQCSVAIQPSLEEGLSMVLPQCMAAGTPLIASSHTGGEDIIVDGESGFIVPIRNSDAIRDKILLLFENPDLLSAIRENALKKAGHFGNWDQYGLRYVEFLKTHLK